MVVELSHTVVSAIREHHRRSTPRVACGLILGRGDERTFQVLRSLPCPNVAPASIRDSSYAIEHRAITNVTRSLEGQPLSVLGSYAVGLPSGGSLRTEAEQWVGGITLFLAGGTEPQVWWKGDVGDPVELPVEWVSTRAALYACPE
jgi:hypothetical protein